jgi:hypothetical protein
VGFQVLPRRWVVERFLAWINRNRRLAKDFEGSIPSANAFLYAACVMLLTRRLGMQAHRSVDAPAASSAVGPTARVSTSSPSNA